MDIDCIEIYWFDLNDCRYDFGNPEIISMTRDPWEGMILPNSHEKLCHICYISILSCRFSGDYLIYPILRYPNVFEPYEFSNQHWLQP